MPIATLTYEVDDLVNINGTSLQLRRVKIPYSKLVDLFGDPLKIEGGDHARYHWPLEFSDGKVLDIYDWNDDRRIWEVDEWNVAAKDFMTAARLYDILEGKPLLEF
jgi:hypothetical protein